MAELARGRLTLVQCAWAASPTKNTYLAAQSHRLAARRGTKGALVAVAHTLLGIGYQVLRNGQTDRELGAASLDQRDYDGLAQRLLRRLAKLGVKVRVAAEPEPVAVERRC